MNDVAEKDVPKYLRVEITPKSEGGDKVNIKVPLLMARMGLKVASLIPDRVLEPLQARLKERGIDFDLTQVNPENADKFFAAMMDMDIHVENDKETVRVYCN